MKMQYQLETEINRPIKEVIRLFKDRTQYPKWQPGLVDMEPVPAETSPTYKLTLQFGRRKMVMTEKILRQDLPQHYEVQYDMRGIRNTNQYTFEAIADSRTRWISREEFHFKGLMNIVAFFMKDGFIKQSTIIMNNFKKFAESQSPQGFQGS